MIENQDLQEQIDKEDDILSAIDVAKYLLILVDREAGDVITQLKLQKLMYIAQGIHLALYDAPLFKEEIEAWQHGPVVRELYHEFKVYGTDPIPLPYKVNVNGFSLKTREFIYQIYAEYGEHSSKYLYQWTHSHKIWQEAIASGSKNISKEKINQFFTDVVNNVKAKFLAILPQQTMEIVQAIKKYEDQYATKSSPIIKIISGTDDFSTLVVGGDLFVDKSLMIKELLDNGSEVILIARPRRWGKSINMSMIKKFFEIEVDVNGNVLADEQKVNKKLFLGGTLELNACDNEPKKLHSLKIASVAYAMKRQGEFPVIFLSLNDIKDNNYQIIEAKVREKIIKVFEDHEYLLNSIYISSLDKKKFEDYLSNNITIDRIHSALLFLSKLLFKHFKQKVYILIDEYDTPINEAYYKFGETREFENVLELFRGIFGSCLKGNEYLEKGVITGILRIAKADLFSDLNNSPYANELF